MWYICHTCHRGFNNRSEFFQHKHDEEQHDFAKEQTETINMNSEICLKSEFGIENILNDKNGVNENYVQLGLGCNDNEPCLFKLEPVPLPKIEEKEWTRCSCEDTPEVTADNPEAKVIPCPLQSHKVKPKSRKARKVKPSIPAPTTNRNLKSVQCKECEKWFSTAYTLKTHSNIHTGLRPFECYECGKKFTQKINLVYHMRTHTGEKPYQCTLCTMSFAQIANLRSHLRRYHRTDKEFEPKSANKS